MQIGELLVRITAESSGVTRGTQKAAQDFARLEGTMQRASGTMTSTDSAVKSLGGSFVALASQATGANPAVTRLVSVVGQFAVGGGIMVGVLAGVTALSAAWTFFTREAKTAKDATQALIDKMIEASNQRALGKTGLQEELRAELLLSKTRLLSERSVLQRSVLPAGVGSDEDQIASAFAERRLRAITGELQTMAKAYIEAGAQIADVRGAEAEQAAKGALSVGDLTNRLIELNLKADAAAGSVESMMRELFDGQKEKRSGVLSGPSGTAGGLPGKFIDAAKAAGAGAKGGGTLDAIVGQLGGALQSLTAAFGPMAIVGELLNGVFAALYPVIEELMVPIRDVGFLIGSAIAPVLKLLQPILNGIAKAFSFVIEGIGYFLKGLGKAISALPFVGDLGLIKTGQGLIDMAKGTRAAIDAGTDLTKTMEKLNSSFVNVPTGFKTNLIRFNASDASGGGIQASSSGTRGAVTFNGPVTIQANDPKEFGRKLRQMANRGGSLELEPAFR